MLRKYKQLVEGNAPLKRMYADLSALTWIKDLYFEFTAWGSDGAEEGG
jgi:hypothetical protein